MCGCYEVCGCAILYDSLAASRSLEAATNIIVVMDFIRNPTPTELVAFGRSVRRRRAAVGTVVALSFGVAALIRDGGGAGWWFAVVWGSAALLSVRIWRCPRCGRLLDRNLLARECSHCYLRFDGNVPTSRPANSR